MSADRKSESLNAIVEMVDAIDKKHEEAHTRLRKESEDHEKRIESNYTYLRDRIELNTTQIQKVASEFTYASAAPINLDKLAFTPKILLTMIGSLITVIATIVVSVWGFTSGQKSEMAAMRSDVRNIQTQMDGQRTTDTAREQLRAVEATAIKNDITEIKRLQQLQQLQLQQVQLQQVTKKGSQ